MLHRGKIVVKPALDDQAVWGNLFVARQGKFMKEWSCLVTMHERKVIVYDFWATRGIREEPESRLLRYFDTSSDSSIPGLENVASDEEGWEDHVVHLVGGRMPNLLVYDEMGNIF